MDTEPVERRGCVHEPTMKGDLIRIEGEFADADDPNADGNRDSPQCLCWSEQQALPSTSSVVDLNLPFNLLDP